MPAETLLTVVYTDAPDEVFEFPDEHHAIVFGRDERRCDLVIWSAINGTELSAVAGRIWRMDDELWVRNLSTSHDLRIELPGHPPLEPLPPRNTATPDPGWARSIPHPVAYLLAPGGCELVVRQQRSAGLPDPALTDGDTIRLPPVPEHLRLVAAALCEPLIHGGRLPAPYHQIASRIQDPSRRRVRNLVAELCQVYIEELPELANRMIERRRREVLELELPVSPTLRGGVWVFPAVDPPPVEERAELRRRRALALPDYYELAHLLVRRRLVTPADLAQLPEANDAGSGDE
jgi:hypothetical protein